MPLDPIKPALKAPGSERLKLKCDELLSNFAFKLNLRRYIMDEAMYFSAGHGDGQVERCRLTL